MTTRYYRTTVSRDLADLGREGMQRALARLREGDDVASAEAELEVLRSNANTVPCPEAAAELRAYTDKIAREIRVYRRRHEGHRPNPVAVRIYADLEAGDES